jgi:hypothetical protein
MVRVAGQKPALDALYGDSGYVGCSFGLCKVSVEVDQKPMMPKFTDLAAVQIGNSLEFFALRAEDSRSTLLISASSSFLRLKKVCYAVFTQTGSALLSKNCSSRT